jgi:DNA-binding PadR family transcriptional regulator
MGKTNAERVKKYQQTEKGKEAVKKAKKKYQQENYKLLSTRVKITESEVFERYCERYNSSKNAVLGGFVKRCIEEQTEFENALKTE